MPGRKMKPTALKLIQGNPGKRPLPENEPKPTVKAPRAPSILSTSAKKHWKKIVKQLADLGIMTDIDSDALALYCEAFTRYRYAMYQISKEGPIIETQNGHMIQHPAMMILNKSFEQMRSLLIEFGMTPSSRTKIQVTKAEADDPLSRLAKKRGRKPAEERSPGRG